MLYDQAQLAVSYTTAFQITKHEQYSDIVHDILQYVSRDLSHKVNKYLPHYNIFINLFIFNMMHLLNRKN